MNDFAHQDAFDSLEKVIPNIRKEIGKRVIGMTDVVDELLIAIIANGHALFVGVPGLAKTTLINSLAELFTLEFSRIQFTPDLMPADITGSEILDEDEHSGKRELRFVKGPLFGNIVLADEINRASPKTQSALLEAMQEKKITVNGKSRPLSPPFLIFATQNPIEQEGTFPLPEAQLDRFMMQINVAYPSAAEEIKILKTTASASNEKITPMVSAADIIVFQQLLREMPVSDAIFTQVSEFVRRTRPQDETAPAWIRDHVYWGAGPRGGLNLILAAKAFALLNGRVSVSLSDLQRVATPVLRHRILLNYKAEAEGMTTNALITKLIESFLQ